MKIRIREQDINSIKKHCEEEFPEECCGFLLGEFSKDEKEVKAVARGTNILDDLGRFNRFLISSTEFLIQERAAKKIDLNVIGFYHSHPDSEAHPSEIDLKNAWPWYSYVIVSVGIGGSKELTSWVLEDDRSTFIEEIVMSN